MVAPIFVGREKSISAIEAAFSGQTPLILCAQREAAVEDPVVRRPACRSACAPGCSSSSSCRTAASRRWSRATSACAPSAWSRASRTSSSSTRRSRARTRGRRARAASRAASPTSSSRYVQLHPQLADEAQFVVQQADDAGRAGRHRRRPPADGGRGEAGAAGDREHAAAPPRPAREPRRGERRARHRAGDRLQGAAAHRGRAAPAAAAREAARAARRDRGGRRGRRRGHRRVRAARRRGRALAGGAQARHARAHQAPAGAADEPRGRPSSAASSTRSSSCPGAGWRRPRWTSPRWRGTSSARTTASRTSRTASSSTSPSAACGPTRPARPEARRRTPPTSRPPSSASPARPAPARAASRRASPTRSGRPFVRVALGGVRDEAEIRGHRRTYIGAMPGRIVDGLAKAGVDNPVMLLDELDKLDSDWRGNPAAALMEVLDPAHNHAFRDNYLEAEYDLSRVFFIATANDVDAIPGDAVRPARGHPPERLHAAREAGHRPAAPAAARGARHGPAPRRRRFGRGALQAIVRGYTREAGVRELERALRRIDRKVARKHLEDGLALPVDGGRRRPARLPRRGALAGGRAAAQRRASGRASASPTRPTAARCSPSRRRSPAAAASSCSPASWARSCRSRRRRPGATCSRTSSATAALGRCVRRSPFLTRGGPRPRQPGRARARARGRRAQGRPVGRAWRSPWRCSRRSAGVPVQAARGHDRRDHAGRPHPARRRPQGEAARRGARSGVRTVVLPGGQPRHGRGAAGGPHGEARPGVCCELQEALPHVFGGRVFTERASKGHEQTSVRYCGGDGHARVTTTSTTIRPRARPRSRASTRAPASSSSTARSAAR